MNLKQLKLPHPDNRALRLGGRRHCLGREPFQANPADGKSTTFEPLDFVVKTAADFTVTNVDGQQIKLSDLKGRRVVIDFGPHPLQDERNVWFPHFDHAFPGCGRDDLVIVGISLRGSLPLWKKFFKDAAINFRFPGGFGFRFAGVQILSQASNQLSDLFRGPVPGFFNNLFQGHGNARQHILFRPRVLSIVPPGGWRLQAHSPQLQIRAFIIC